MAASNTNVLAIPQAQASIATGTNEDWLDTFEYLCSGTADDPGPPLDLRGISFELMVRRNPDDAEVIVWASSADNTIQIGASPDWNFLIINVPLATMRTRTPGIYNADMVARDAVYQRVIMTIDLEIVDGITK